MSRNNVACCRAKAKMSSPWVKLAYFIQGGGMMKEGALGVIHKNPGRKP